MHRFTHIPSLLVSISESGRTFLLLGESLRQLVDSTFFQGRPDLFRGNSTAASGRLDPHGDNSRGRLDPRGQLAASVESTHGGGNSLIPLAPSPLASRPRRD